MDRRDVLEGLRVQDPQVTESALAIEDVAHQHTAVLRRPAGCRDEAELTGLLLCPERAALRGSGPRSGEEGPSALSTRRLAREAGTSTMAVYTHFGGMSQLVGEVADEGFRRLIARTTQVRASDDPVDDLLRMAAAYRANAHENRYLYVVMFGAAPLGRPGHEAESGDAGVEAFAQLRDAVARAMSEGSLRTSDPSAVAGQFWSALHG